MANVAFLNEMAQPVNMKQDNKKEDFFFAGTVLLIFLGVLNLLMH